MPHYRSKYTFVTIIGKSLNKKSIAIGRLPGQIIASGIDKGLSRRKLFRSEDCHAGRSRSRKLIVSIQAFSQCQGKKLRIIGTGDQSGKKTFVGTILRESSSRIERGYDSLFCAAINSGSIQADSIPEFIRSKRLRFVSAGSRNQKKKNSSPQHGQRFIMKNAHQSVSSTLNTGNKERPERTWPNRNNGNKETP